jgi:F0F1-type ATP synthase epsilon subunit
MANEFKVLIVDPEKIIYEGVALSLVVPGEFGFLGVLAHHAPLVASTLAGKLRLKDSSGQWCVFNLERKGFIEVLNNNVTLLLS